MDKSENAESISRLARRSHIQPRGGFFAPGDMDVFSYVDTTDYCEEMGLNRRLGNIKGALFGQVFEMMFQFEYELDHSGLIPALRIFQVGLLGAVLVVEMDEYLELVSKVMELYSSSDRNYRKIIYVFEKITKYIAFLRSGWFDKYYLPPRVTVADEKAIRSALTATRSLIDKYGYEPVFNKSFNVDDAKNMIKSACDLIVGDTLFDFKCCKSTPSKADTLQLVLYYLAGKHEDAELFDGIKHLAIVNPVLGRVFSFDVDDLDKDTLRLVETEVAGYSPDNSVV